MKNDTSVVEAVDAVERVSQLRNMLLYGKKEADPRIGKIRARAFDLMIASAGEESAVVAAVKWTFGEIAASSPLSTNALLVADVLKGWGIIYPESKRLALNALLVEANSYLNYAGEGIVIGLLELYAKEMKDEDLFRALFGGSIPMALRTSQVTPAGSGRLANALAEFVAPIWDHGSEIGIHRLPQTMLTLRRYWNLAACGPGSVIFPDLTYCASEDLMRHFTNELASKVFLAGNPTVKLSFLCQGENPWTMNFKEWNTRFPHLASR